MPRPSKPLTELRIRKTSAGATEKRLYDGDGLYLSVMPTGARWWRLKYRFAGLEKRMGLGSYPETSLSAAREKRDAARALLRKDIDPGAQRRSDQLARKMGAKDTFKAVATEWLGRSVGKGGKAIADITASKNRWLMETYAIPALGSRPIAEITPREVLAMLRRVEADEKLETASRLKTKCAQVFRYAIVTGRAELDPTVALMGALRAPTPKHHASITDPKRIGTLLRAIDGYDGQPMTKAALRLSPLLFVRPGELRRAEWSEIDLKAGEWKIPAKKMKMKEPHIVPLAKQAVAILEGLHALTKTAPYVFHSVRTIRKPLSENTVNAALRGLGFSKDEMTAHGFRSMASTLLNEQGWNRDAIERQLAHAERDNVRAAYNYAQHLPERRKMMQAWADYLDGLKENYDNRPSAHARKKPQ
jgi:integrase